MIIVGIVLLPFVALLIHKINLIYTKKRVKTLLQIGLLFLGILYLNLCLFIKTEPFSFEINNVLDYVIYAMCVFSFSPVLWIIVGYYNYRFLHKFRVFKKGKISSKNQYSYYRDDLDHISPSIIMFTSAMTVDLKRALASTLLKLKLTGYLVEFEGYYYCTGKNQEGLGKTEQYILESIQKNVFHSNVYKRLIKEETLNGHYLKKASKITSIISILLLLLIPPVLTISSIQLDDYLFHNFHIYKENNDVTYVFIRNEKAVEKLQEEIKNKNGSDFNINSEDEYLHGISGMIRADRLEYGVIRYAWFLNILMLTLFVAAVISYVTCIEMIIIQLFNLNKEYKRTIKGNELLNKAYALRRYLKDYSIINQRSEEELVLWEYYLIYAVLFDVNQKIQDDIFEKLRFRQGYQDV